MFESINAVMEHTIAAFFCASLEHMFDKKRQFKTAANAVISVAAVFCYISCGDFIKGICLFFNRMTVLVNAQPVAH